MRHAWIAFVALTLIGCSKSPTHAAAPNPYGPPTLQVSSTMFAAGAPIPLKCGSLNGNVSPSLEWGAAPSGTKSFALLLEDPDAPGSQPFVHWMVVNIPAATLAIPENGKIKGSLEGVNDNGSPGYFGPQPPSGVHHYHFPLFALDTTLTLGAGFGRVALEGALKGHVLAWGELVGTYSG